ncbi:MAG: hypothetical protein J07HQW2_02105 [Haloquadratum walsbyi J07HQW2]|uniref:DUF424 domain-containing protein n=1 Tax=Haloquadratum walsbyi J07HQW2 TaxID=1238425 RepID=U1NF05_9EURY|nr:DUF424 domain-containing protein [Haloquadratum walsbyi]ERG95645.1 MAG: hypothetical protein J07HQW2_02105 [Haloquadratum walsbyi J07HQW2]
MTESERGSDDDIVSESGDSFTSAPESESDSTAVPTPTGVDDDSDDRAETDDDEILILRERQTPEGLLVAVCDSHCLGETYVDGDVSLDVTESFYGGSEAEEVDEKTAIKSLTRASVANIVGKHAVTTAVEAGIVDEDRVLRIDETLHAQLVWM